MNADFICVHRITNEMQLATNTSEKSFYPDLIEKGGLVSALQFALLKINSPLKVEDNDLSLSGFPVYARVESKNRFSQIYIGSEQRVFITDFWESGIMLGNANTDDLIELAQVLNEWLETSISLTELSEKFELVKLEDKTKYFEAGREIEWQWQSCQNYIPQHFPELVPFLNEASQNPILHQLFPFTSMNTFNFSRCTGFPYSYDCPVVVPTENNLENNRYKILNSKGEFIGEGNAKEVVESVIKHLPVNTGTAKRGTAEDL